MTEILVILLNASLMRTVITHTSEVTTPISAVAMVTCVITTYPKTLFQSPGELQQSPMDQVTKHLLTLIGYIRKAFVRADDQTVSVSNFR